MKYKIIALMLTILSVISFPSQAGIFKWIGKGAAALKSGVVKSGRFAVEVGAGVTAAIVYASVTRASVTIDGQYIYLSESVLASNESGFSTYIPSGRYFIRSQTGNMVSIASPSNNIDSLTLRLT